MSQTWSIRSYEEFDENEIYELTKIVWKNQVPEKDQWIKGWRWMYIYNPAGASMMWLSEVDSKIVGQDAVVLENMKIGGEIVKASQMVDMMVHPGYRKQGMASAFEKTALNEVKRKGLYLIFGFPNQQAYPIHMKYGWLDICAFQLMIKPLDLRRILGKYVIHNKFLLEIFAMIGNLIIKMLFRTKNSPKVSGLTITKILCFDNRIDDFWKKVSDDYNIIVVRDKKYLNWRYFDAPNKHYMVYIAEKEGEICGYMVLGCKMKDDMTFGYIFDIIAPMDREDIIQCLILKAVDCFKKEKVVAIFAKMVANGVYRKSFLKNGFAPHFKYKGRFIIYNPTTIVPEKILKNPKNWFIQLGDSVGAY